MSFQTEVAAFLAAQMLARARVGQRFRLNHSEQIVSLRLESGKGVDDVIATLTGGGKVSIQCKTSLSISGGEKSDFNKTVGQFVEELVADPALDPAANALVIAVPTGAAAPLDTLLAACARVGVGGLTELASSSEAEQGAFGKLKTCADRAYASLAPGTTPDYRRLAQLFRVARFERGPTGSLRIDGAALLGRALYGGDAAGSAAFTEMVDAIREDIKTGHPFNRSQLLNELRRRGQADMHAPGFDDDLAKIAADTKDELERLRRYGRLPLGDYQLKRASQKALFHAVQSGSLLVIGEPGAGKSGALGILADQWEAIGPTVILSVDRFAGIGQTRQLSDELRLEHDLVDVLSAWPGDRPGLLIIDALDAARGGQAEAIFVGLVERVAKLSPRWRIAASVRTFDLLNGQRLRGLLPGSPPSPDYADPAASTSRHFLLPALKEDERRALAADRPELAALLNSKNAKLAALLTNIFNLSLAADLVANGTPATSFEGVTTQSDLIDQYENRRIPNKPARSAMIAAVTSMVDLKALTLRTAELDHLGLEDLLRSGILVERDDRYGFAHHILFDHVAGRFFIDAQTNERLIAQLKGLGGKAFMLSPALRFALERFWRRDNSAKRAATWKLLLTLAQQRDLGPIAAASALRTAAEQVQSNADLDGLADEVASAPPEPINRTIFQLARFVAMQAEAGLLTLPAATAWAGFAERIALRGERLFVEPARFLLFPLSTAGDFGDGAFLPAFGSAARAGLASARAAGIRYNHARSMGIDFVGQSYASDASASRAALEPFLAKAWLDDHSHEDAAPIARALRFIMPLDPEFAAAIFSAILNQPVPSDAQTDMSGSRILGLTSTRAQDFKHSFHYLRKAFQAALAKAPGHSPALLSIASLAKRGRKTEDAIEKLAIQISGEPDVVILLDGLDVLDWRQKREHGDPADVEIPQAFADHVAKIAAPELETIVRAAKAGQMASSVWRRILGGQISADRRGPIDALLWPIAANPGVIESSDLGRDAIDYLRAVYPTTPAADRASFERAIASHSPHQRKRWKLMLDRLVTALPVDHLATAGMKRRRSTLEKNDGLEGNPAAFSYYTPHGRVLRPGRNEVSVSRIGSARAKVEKAAVSYREAKSAEKLGLLWHAIASAVRLADKEQVEGDDASRVWGAIAEGFAILVRSRVLTSGEAGIPALAELVALAIRLAASEYPANDDGDLSYSNHAVRVYAAEAVMGLAHRFLAEEPSLAEAIDRLLSDAVAIVRYKIIERLPWLKAQDELMWQLVQRVATTEPHLGLLAVFVARTLSPLSEEHPDKIEPILAAVDAIADARSDKNCSNLSESIAHLATEMAVDDARPAAMALIEEWASRSPIKSDRLCDVIPMMRGRFFYSYLPESDERKAFGERARHIGHVAVRASAGQMAQAKSRLEAIPAGATGGEKFVEWYNGANQVLDQVVTQLYFGSGSNKDAGPTDISLDRADQKLAFFADWSDPLLATEAVATPHTIKYLLEIYEHLLDANPPLFFDRIATFLRGAAAAEYYQHEQLAAADLVKFVRHMLADHRSLFDDDAQRDRLIAILEVFADEGWPEAMRLLWELPDLLR